MLLKRRLQWIGVVAILAGGAIALVVGHTSADIRRDIDQLALVHEVERTSADLVIVMQEYALHGEPRARVQWERRHEALEERLARLTGLDPAAREQRDRVALHAGRMQRQFALLTEREPRSGATASVDARAEELLVGQLLVESYVMIGAASQLATLVTRRVDTGHRRGSVLITALVAALVVGVVVASVAAWRGLGRGLERLRSGATQVSGGDLSVRIGPPAGGPRDEIEEVAVAIDTSTAALGVQRGLLSLSHRMSVAANASDSPGMALRTALQVICEFTGWPVGHALMQPRPGAGIVSARIWHGADDPRYARLRATTEPLRFENDEPGVVASVVRTRKLRFVSEIDLGTNPIRGGALREAGLRRHVAMPVLLGDEVAAVLEFFSGDAGAMSAALLDTLEQIGVQLGRVFERERAR
ncbi:MAG: GAF domain-containing protein, partial [Planctomycetes bacterium]|nr:GAF domain-containing protein [Planctomycetota bacterium]